MHCSFSDEYRIIFLLDFIKGGEFFQHLKKKIRFNEEEVVFFMA
jgi:hypothetical protein